MEVCNYNATYRGIGDTLQYLLANSKRSWSALTPLFPINDRQQRTEQIVNRNERRRN